MLTYTLKGSAQITNGFNLEPLDNPEYPFDYKFMVKCTRCRAHRDKPIQVTRYEYFPVTQFVNANLVMKCKDCKSERYINVERLEGKLESESTPIVRIVTHGLEILSFIADDQFQCQNAENETVQEIDLSEGGWTDGEIAIRNVRWDVVLERGQAALAL
ncbi:uncharacterized protein CANTADRAFT_19925 [Suhomyces tanzawaensis NRRL Y-17324]|uniref:DUF866-domain-containing protein n=1 Tax=Suhomyces tanzawaensis NRRL Y-17324 TaxID=984487 RepID=A0A1E4SSJ4_9ASCO|nr:uncharacterized protein CANTADRAFT_19925 [Suhomyces tanzawaensis NRRL Y-17324]ODV82362.1 hypothetical protein CANTADRAFT_19925 [Suhomyces tanzawaensis NRRL Y-17324]